MNYERYDRWKVEVEIETHLQVTKMVAVFFFRFMKFFAKLCRLIQFFTFINKYQLNLKHSVNS